MEHIDTIIIGAGVVGLATARAMAMAGHDVLILERENAIGTITSARNSGVIHAGLYYKPNSLKTKFCVEGRDLLYAYARERGITHKQCGKLVVATSPEQIPALHALQKNAVQNGLVDLQLLSAHEASAIEPTLHCTKALHVPISGMIDVHELMQNLLGDAEAHGANLVLNTPVLGCSVTSELVVRTGGDTLMELSCRNLINAAGLGAQSVAHTITGLNVASIPPLVLAKGNYFTLSGKAPFERLIYPLPDFGSSGLHFSCDFGGQARFGPDVEWVEELDYRVDSSRKASFADSIRRYWPDLPADKLQPDYSGIRPKLGRTSQHDSDFVIQTAEQHGIKGLINLYGIESPGLTSSMAIGAYVKNCVFYENELS